MADVSSSDLEKAYEAYLGAGSDAQPATLKFQAGKHKYELDFQGTSAPRPPPSRAWPWVCCAFSTGTLEQFCVHTEGQGRSEGGSALSWGDRPVSR